MTRWSIRARLALWYAAVLMAGLALLGTGIWLVVSHSLRGSLDEVLNEHVQGIITVLQSENEPERPRHLSEELTEYVAAAPGGNLMEVRDSRDRPIVAGKTVVMQPADPSHPTIFGVQTTSSGRYRTLTKTTSVNGETYRILAATPLDPTEATLRRVALLLLWASPAMLLLASLGGYWISRGALLPVDEMTKAARSIGIQNLSQRLAAPATGDELQRLAETWNEMLARLEAAVKRLSQFTADASHELRTPIALIRTTAELTLRRERSVETYREALSQIVAESEKTAKLVEDLLLLARADAGRMSLPLERVELTPLVRDVYQQGQVLAEAKQLEISADLPEEPVFVEANDPALRRMLLLLLDNALKYTPAGGHITLSVNHDPDSATVAVRDTGIGIPQTALPHVFERFYRVDESRSRGAGGTGLGLSIAKWIADRHHASLDAESVVGEGSVFRIRFRLN
jgi:heavy metal sensor kinase